MSGRGPKAKIAARTTLLQRIGALSFVFGALALQVAAGPTLPALPASPYKSDPDAELAATGLATITVDGSAVRYEGLINEPSVAAFAEVLANARKRNQPIREVVIKSRGGMLDYGLGMGELVRDNGLAVTIDELCASACANNVAIPARELRVPQGALLAFHGGAPKTFNDEGKFLPEHEKELRSYGFSDSDLVAQLARDKENYAREEALYNSVGVSRSLLTDSSFAHGTTSRRLMMFTQEVLEKCYNVTNIKSYPRLEGDEIHYGKSTAVIVRSCAP